MHHRPKLIMLGGFAGCGKTTIANKYVSENPLALSIEGDEIITKLGQWRTHMKEAVTCNLSLTAAMAVAHLKGGHDIVLPFLLRDASHAAHYEGVARIVGADFLEFTLSTEKSDAVQRLFKRGTWGEAGVPPLAPEDMPKAERLYDSMIEAIDLRPNMINIRSKIDDIDGTYKDFVAAITRAENRNDMRGEEKE